MPDPSRITLAPLHTEAALRQRVGELVAEIVRDTAGRDLVVVGLLSGSFMFMADLVRELHRRGLALVVDFISTSSYRGTESTGEVLLLRDLRASVANRQVLLVDDILDTGRTLNFAHALLQDRGPAGLRTCVFLDKPARRVEPFRADYVGFTVPDQFIVGYGLDYDGRYRELPYLATLSFAGQPTA